MRTLVLKHETGLRANQSDTFPADHLKEVFIGRDPMCAVVYPEAEDSVSRKHAKIVQDPNDPTRFTLIDLDSANGTFVNDRAVGKRTAIKHGDRIRFGNTGPTLAFRLDPPPPDAHERSDSAGGQGVVDLHATRIEQAPAAGGRTNWWAQTALGRQRGADSRTETQWNALERSTRKQKRLIAILVSVLVLTTGLVVAALFVDSDRLFFDRQLSPEAINAQNRNAVVDLELSWKIVDSDTGSQMFHWYVRNPYMATGGAWEPLRNVERVPVYIRFRDGGVEPVLIPDAERQTNRAIGGTSAGTGFVVHPSGFLLADRRNVAPWMDPYVWAGDTGPGIIVDLETRTASVLTEPPRSWVPAHARYVINRIPRLEAIVAGEVSGAERTVYGRADRFLARFAGGSTLRATLEATRDTHPVALARVTPLESLESVQLAPRDAPSTGAASFIGLARAPASVKSGIGSMTASAMVFHPSTATADSPPACSGCVVVDSQGLSVSASGAPLFNNRGQVAAILDVSGQHAVAIPIAYGWQIMGIAP